MLKVCTIVLSVGKCVWKKEQDIVLLEDNFIKDPSKVSWTSQWCYTQVGCVAQIFHLGTTVSCYSWFFRLQAMGSFIWDLCWQKENETIINLYPRKASVRSIDSKEDFRFTIYKTSNVFQGAKQSSWDFISQ